MHTTLFFAIAVCFLASCQVDTPQSVSGEPMLVNIKADRQPCQGLVPMQCLVVNGQTVFYEIEGYDHVEGESAQICVIRSKRPEPVPADAGLYTYRKVDCE